MQLVALNYRDVWLLAGVRVATYAVSLLDLTALAAII